jgi:hypothetical protein
MPHSVEGLSVIANKTPVVGTHVGSFSAASIEQTQERYQLEALTYVRPEDISIYQHRLLDRILTNKASIGCIVAPFGYGKTSAAIDTWKVCNENGLLAILPFSCSSVAEMGKAISTGIEYRLGRESRGAKRVRAAYEAYLVSSAKRLAEQDSVHYHIDFDTALRSIEDKIERGYLHIDATGSHLLGLLEQLTQIVLESDFKGLLIIVDEFQQFLGNINKVVITNFRTLVWGLRTRGALPLGLLITMDPDTERNLAERAGDILHRIKEDTLYLDFTDAYDRGFARLLWAKYAENFHFAEKNLKIIDTATLDAIGQICERHDLSNGPRTVIDLFQRIAHLYPIRKKPYTPIDLIDDFLSGEIRFDGDRSKISSLVGELTSYEYIKTSPQRLQTLKLISAFPRGCSKVTADSYGLGPAFKELSDALRGEVLTELPDGMALIDLQRVGKPQNKLNMILKKYWMQITEDEIVNDRVVTLFAKYALSPLFQPYQSVLSGWSTVEPTFRLTPSGSYTQTYEGSFFEEYPKRRVCVEICRQKEQVSDIDKSCDVHFAFVLQLSDEELIQPSYDRRSQTFVAGVAINHPFGIPMPRDVRWIEDYLRPVVMSPAVVLSLIDYINSQAPKINEVTENELQRIQAYSKKLNDFLIAVVFGPELFSGPESVVISRGEQAFRNIIFQTMNQAYPGYQTLITSPQWENLCKAYIDVLSNSNPLYTRGIEPLIDEKTKIATLFGFRNHAGFESQIRQYRGLAVLENWNGKQGEIRFERHPGEELLLQALGAHKELSQDALIETARQFGYLPVETNYLLEFLSLRGYIEKRKNGHYRQAQTLSKAELMRIAKESEAEAIEILSIVKLPELAEKVSQTILHVKDERKLLEAQIQVLQFQRIVQSSRSLAIKQIQNTLTQFRASLYQKADAISKDIPVSSTGLFIDAHINGAQRGITSKSRGVLRKVNKLTVEVNKMLNSLAKQDSSVNCAPLIQKNKTLYREIEVSLKELQDLILLVDQQSDWVQFADRLLLIQEYLKILKTRFEVKSFNARYNSICRKLMETLSVKGIKVYAELYREYSPRVTKLYDEISVAIKATRINDQYIEKRIPGMTSRAKSKRALLTLLRRKGIRFKDVVQNSGLKTEDLLSALVQLENDREIMFTFLVKKMKD